MSSPYGAPPDVVSKVRMLSAYEVRGIRKAKEKDRAITADLQRIVNLPGGLVTLFWYYASSLKQLSGRTAHLPFGWVLVAIFRRNTPLIDETGSHRPWREHAKVQQSIGKHLLI